MQINTCSQISRAVGYHASGYVSGLFYIDTTALIGRTVIYQVTLGYTILTVDTATLRSQGWSLCCAWIAVADCTITHLGVGIVDIDTSTMLWLVNRIVLILVASTLDGETFQIHVVRKSLAARQRSKPDYMSGTALYVPCFILLAPGGIIPVESVGFQDGFVFPSPWFQID